MPPSADKDNFIRQVLAEGLYSVDEHGQIFSHVRKKARLIKQSLMSDGYCRVGLSRAGEVHYVKAHRVVGLARVPNPRNKPLINHDDGVKSNNHPSNLIWATEVENAQHAVRTGLLSMKTGEDCGAAKLTRSQIKEIRKLWSTGAHTQKQLGTMFGVKQNTVSVIVNEINWR